MSELLPLGNRVVDSRVWATKRLDYSTSIEGREFHKGTMSGRVL